MLSALFLLYLLAGSSIAGPDVLNQADLKNIEKEMSRKVEEEFSGKKHQDELALVKKQFAASHFGNETYILIPTEVDINVNHTERSRDISTLSNIRQSVRQGCLSSLAIVNR